ncbi:MAG: Phosphate-binding protein PstS precursor [Lentisphaerae bacterium ADurb.BinA184]|nr:MAG: Phosphate-binding protein PstS precursor [Lentisphaerae bacterium ADurb.BinA184]
MTMMIVRLLRHSSLLAVLCLAGAFEGLAVADEAPAGQTQLPEYQAVEGVAGNLNSIGSDTLNNLLTYWAEGFRRLYPNVNIGIEGKGSGTAPPALIAGTAQLGPMSRAMKKSEITEFQGKYGFKPTEISVALDSLAVFVNKDNPVESLTLAQVDSMFSKSCKRGLPPARTWGDVGVKDAAWAGRPISLYGRNSASGTYGFFKEDVLRQGDYRDEVKEQPGSASVVMGITGDRAAAGYSGIGYKTSGVKALPIAGEDGQPYAPEQANVASGKYPIWRPLHIYVVRKPGRPLDPLTREFLRFVLSGAGQEIVVKDGFYPLSAAQVAEQLKKIE